MTEESAITPRSAAGSGPDGRPLASGRALPDPGEAEAAIPGFLASLEEEPRNEALHYQLGRALLATGRAGDARAPLRLAARNGELRMEALRLLALAEWRAGRFARAAVTWRRVARALPDATDARLDCARALLRIGKSAEALQQAQDALRLEPTLAEAHELQGLALFRQRRFKDAAAAFARGAGDGSADAIPLFLQARAAVLAHDWQAARVACQRALALAPDVYRGHLLMVRIALASRNMMLAQAHLQRAIALRPNSAESRARMAEVMALRSQFKAALEMASSACALDADNFAARVVIARCQVALGRLAAAQDLVDQLERQRPNWPGLDKVRALLALRQRSPGPGSSPTAPQQDAAPPTEENAEPDVAPQAPASHGSAVVTASSEAATQDIGVPPIRGDSAPNAETQARGSAVEAASPFSNRRRSVVDDLFIIHALIFAASS